MTLQPVTVQLPKRIYQQVKEQAEARYRSVEDELVAVVTAALPEPEDLPAELMSELNQLKLLTDDELWQAARTTMKSDDVKRMETLSTKQRGKGLTKTEREEVEELLYRHDRVMLLRAKAAVLLKERDHDISVLIQ